MDTDALRNQHNPRDTRGSLRMLLKPVIAAWPDVVIPEKGRPFRKYAAVALVEHVLVDHVNFHTSPGDVLFTNDLGFAGLAPHAPTLAELGAPVGLDRRTVATILDWLVAEGVLAKRNHGRLRATVWSFEPLMNVARRDSQPGLRVLR